MSEAARTLLVGAPYPADRVVVVPNGRDFVLDRFSLDRQVSSTARVYREVVGTPRRLPRAA